MPEDFGAIAVELPSEIEIELVADHLRGGAELPVDPTLGDKFEGDIAEITSIHDYIQMSNSKVQPRNAIRFEAILDSQFPI